jgi:hypothetical protein
MTIIAYLLLVLSALWLIGVSIFILFCPATALCYLAKFASTNLINVSELVLRMIAGFAFLQYAVSSRFPSAFVIIGWFPVATSGLLLLTPRRWHAAYAVYWSRTLTPTMARAGALFSFLAGILLLGAIH